MNLSKKQREDVRMMFGGRCSYCGNQLGKTWHADHVEAVGRVTVYKRNIGYVQTGEMNRPENDTIENLMPACVPCNINKGDLPLAAWRKWLEESHDRLLRNYAAYKHAHRFGLIAPVRTTLVFYFERYQQRTPLMVTLD